MITPPIEIAWPEVADTVSLTDLALACTMSLDDLRELVEFGALLPLDARQPEPLFAMGYMDLLRIASKLRRDYDLELFVVVIVMDYLQHIGRLEAQLQRLLAQSVRPAWMEPPTH